MKPRQLSDAIYEEVGDKVQSQISEAVEVDDIVSDNEPTEPPGFYLSHNHNNNSHPSQQQEGMQPMPHVKEPSEEQKEEPQRSQVMLETPGLSTDLQHQQPGDDNDEDPDVPPGFG
ncbi:hypothetical protein Ddye_007203 [Dipteronia dyeriana]|uniref:Uncharacterized protein n=1 Tax=Dipteronia dyeriana TaxID=168575 RepID=A0AAE0CR89_9ROSI|nr:hypothetical protein Ddye_007203 [Dipteronia dyeriana]